jgi:hypothetical protein
MTNNLYYKLSSRVVNLVPAINRSRRSLFRATHHCSHATIATEAARTSVKNFMAL